MDWPPLLAVQGAAGEKRLSSVVADRFFVEDWAGETFTTLSQLSISTSSALAATKLTCQHQCQASMYRYMCLVGDDGEDTLLNDMPILGPERKCRQMQSIELDK